MQSVRPSPIFAALTMLALAFTPDHASACSCAGPDLQRRIAPADGAVDFPIDGTLRVFLSGFPESVRADVAAGYRLRDAAGGIVALDVQLVGTRVDLRPHASLSPTSTYALEQIFAYDAGGARLTDLEHLWARRPLRGIWAPVATFQTSAVSATSRTVMPSITSARLRFARGGGDCGPATTLTTELTLPPAAVATDFVELRVRSQGVVDSGLSTGLASLHAGDTDCNPDPVMLAAGESLDVQLVVIDAAGHELGASPWVTATGSGTRPTSRARISPLGAHPWPAVTIVAAPATGGRGPRACANGLEVVGRHELVGDHAPSAYRDRTTLSTDGTSRWAAYAGADGAPMELFTVRADGTGSRVSTALGGQPTALAPLSAGGTFLTYATYPPGGPWAGHVTRLAPDGAAGWTADLAGVSRVHRLARGGGRVLVAWSVEQALFSHFLALSIFDEQTGAVVMASGQTLHELDANAVGPAIAWVRGRFLVVWATGHDVQRGPLASMTVTGARMGPVRLLPSIPTHSPPDLVAAGNQAGLATATDDGRVLFTMLDRRGAVASGPFEVGIGIGGRADRRPRIGWNGSMFAIAWETFPAAGTYVVVADATGAVSSALRVDADEPDATAMAISPTANGWLAAYTTENGHGRTAELRCAAAAPPGPPQSIDAAPPDVRAGHRD